jgi:DNA-binding NarL/FixJ family response regulator
MSIHIVGRSKLFRELLCDYCRSHGFESRSSCEAPADIGTIEDGDVLLLHTHDTAATLQAQLTDLRKRTAKFRLVLITGLTSPSPAEAALMPNVEAVIPEEKSLDALVSVLTAVLEGYRVVLPKHDPGQPAPQDVTPGQARLHLEISNPGRETPEAMAPLSKRERAVLGVLMDGGSNKDIANRLGICEATVKAHLRTCFRKIGAKNRTQAAIWAADWLANT